MIRELLLSRRSIRRFKNDTPSRDTISDLIEMAVTAPSASNKQPWRFYITDNRETIDRMAISVQSAVDRIALFIDPDYQDAFRAYGDYFIRFRNAPWVIVPCYREIVVLSQMVNIEISPGDLDQIKDMEFTSGVVSTALAIQNLMLYAHSIGLGTSCMTGPMVARDDFKTLLGIPESWRIAATIAVGYPDEEPTPAPRKATDAVIRWVDSKLPQSVIANAVKQSRKKESSLAGDPPPAGRASPGYLRREANEIATGPTGLSNDAGWGSN